MYRHIIGICNLHFTCTSWASCSKHFYLNEVFADYISKNTVICCWKNVRDSKNMKIRVFVIFTFLTNVVVNFEQPVPDILHQRNIPVMMHRHILKQQTWGINKVAK